SSRSVAHLFPLLTSRPPDAVSPGGRIVVLRRPRVDVGHCSPPARCSRHYGRRIASGPWGARFTRVIPSHRRGSRSRIGGPPGALGRQEPATRSHGAPPRGEGLDLRSISSPRRATRGLRRVHPGVSGRSRLYEVLVTVYGRFSAAWS